ncbi:protein ANTAGONIST OF LIKE HETEROCHROMATIN PROTEIN 1-like [Scomber scombrus]|uniref:Protein ANTAGONIST OF LIKE HETEROCHROMATIN PROTEIN 1-like n=2 Tax=Scomber scombrus TaxID=13677 RepID=A0AAV1Q5E6_SCOSC
MALTCCVLHNICEEHGDNFMEELPGRHIKVQPAVQALPDNGNPEGNDVRAALMEYFCQN